MAGASLDAAAWRGMMSRSAIEPIDSVNAEPVWRKSSFCFSGECIEVARDAIVLVRDSKHPDDGALRFSTGTWRSFVSDVRAGRFDDSLV